MSYTSPAALRQALEQRLVSRSIESGVALDRLRRRVLFERIVARLHAAEPGKWVLKGGMALEVRLRDEARSTKDVDFGLRADELGAETLHERVVAALAVDRDGDRFVLTAGSPKQLDDDDGGVPTWRLAIRATLAGKQFGGLKIDVSPRPDELMATEVLVVPNSLDFAGVAPAVVEVIALHRHAAEKFHGMLRDFGDRENTRVRDLVDLVILVEHGLLDPTAVAASVATVWSERDGTRPPAVLPPLPTGWPLRYEVLAGDHHLAAGSFADGVAVVSELWVTMFPNEEI